MTDDDLLERIYAQAEIVSRAWTELGVLIRELEDRDREANTSSMYLTPAEVRQLEKELGG
jgi:hypothetical protein